MNHGCVLSIAVAACMAPAALAQNFILVSDGVGNRIVRYRYTTGQPYDHFVGKGVSPLNGPQFISRDAEGRILVASRDSDSVECYDPFTGEFIQTVIPSGLGGLDAPKAVCVDEDGFMYVASALTNQILKYTPQGAFLSVLISVGLDDPSAMAFGPDGYLYVSSRGNDKVRFYDKDTGERIDVVDTTGVNLDAPNGIAFDSLGNLYISGRDSNNIIRKTPFGSATQFVSPGPGLLVSPGQMIVDNTNNLIVACAGSNSVLKYGLPGGNFQGTVVANNNLGGAVSVSGIGFGSDGGSDFLGCNPADLNQDGAINVDDVEAFVTNFLDGCPGEG